MDPIESGGFSKCLDLFSGVFFLGGSTAGEKKVINSG